MSFFLNARDAKTKSKAVKQRINEKERQARRGHIKDEIENAVERGWSGTGIILTGSYATAQELRELTAELVNEGYSVSCNQGNTGTSSLVVSWD